MTRDDVRTFQIDKSRKIYCGLSPKQENTNIIEIQIRKIGLDMNNCKDCSQFQMVGEESDVYLACRPGNYHVNIQGTASGCGISKIFIQLCLNEPKIHEVQYIANQAMNFQGTDWVRAHCKKIVYLDNLNKPSNLVSLYLEATILSQFKLTFIKLLDSSLQMYPINDVYKTKDLLKRYYGMGGMVNYDKVINDQGRQWFFCYPCEGNKCTIS